MKDFLKELHENKNVNLYRKKRIPVLHSGHNLPNELIELYNFCGGMGIFDGELCSTEIVQPKKFVLANKWLLGEELLQELQASDEQHHLWKSNTWYIFANLLDGNYVVIDVNEEKNGWCYLATFGNYAYDENGNMPIIAKSPKEFLERTLQMNEETFYWEEKNFKPYGNVFD